MRLRASASKYAKYAIVHIHMLEDESRHKIYPGLCVGIVSLGISLYIYIESVPHYDDDDIFVLYLFSFSIRWEWDS